MSFEEINEEIQELCKRSADLKNRRDKILHDEKVFLILCIAQSIFSLVLLIGGLGGLLLSTSVLNLLGCCCFQIAGYCSLIDIKNKTYEFEKLFVGKWNQLLKEWDKYEKDLNETERKLNELQHRNER